MTTKFKHIGSVSHGTMRAEDLIPRFAELLDELKEELSLSLPLGASFDRTESVKREVSRIDNLLAQIEQRRGDDDESYYESDESTYDLESLTEELENFAPSYFYFGAHEGDGSDYGFWLSRDSLECAEEDGEFLKVDDTSEVPDDYIGEVLHVNDHGNCTLYAANGGELTEIWSIV